MKKTVKDSRFFIKLSNEKAVNNCFCEYLLKLPCYAADVDFVQAEIICRI